MNLYIVKYGSDNDFWEVVADSKEDAVCSFCTESGLTSDDVNHVYLAVEV